MNWQTPYGDPLLSALLGATLHTLLHCAGAFAVAVFLGSLLALVWYESRGVLALAMKTLVGLMDAMGPVLPALAVLSALQIKSEWTIAVILGGMTWNPVAAFLKEEADSLSKAPFIQAAVVLGVPGRQVLLRHIIPHIVSRLSPLLLGMFASYVGILGALGFLGVAGDARHDLGFMIYDAKSFVRQNPPYFVGAFICFLVLILVPHLLAQIAARRTSSLGLRTRES